MPTVKVTQNVIITATVDSETWREIFGLEPYQVVESVVFEVFKHLDTSRWTVFGDRDNPGAKALVQFRSVKIET